MKKKIQKIKKDKKYEKPQLVLKDASESEKESEEEEIVQPLVVPLEEYQIENETKELVVVKESKAVTANAEGDDNAVENADEQGKAEPAQISKLLRFA